jgi:hypothetical protein
MFAIGGAMSVIGGAMSAVKDVVAYSGMRNRACAVLRT